MKFSKTMTNERGMTLVEMLAALVILGIVFIGFMTVFPQMTNFDEKTMTKLETMNLAEIERGKLLKESASEEYRNEKMRLTLTFSAFDRHDLVELKEGTPKVDAPPSAKKSAPTPFNEPSVEGEVE